MTTSYVAILAWTLASLFLPRLPSRSVRAERRAANPIVVATLCAALVASLEVALAIVRAAALRNAYHGITSGLPVVVLADDGTGDAVTSNAMQLVSIVQTLLLFGLYRALAGRRAGRATVLVVGTACAALIGLSVTSPVTGSSDLYGYVGFALQPATAYAPAGVPLGGAYAPIDAMFGTPRPAAWYGPLWIAVSQAVTAPFAGLLARVTALRILEAAAMLACLAILARRGMPFATLALVAVNPALCSLYLVDGHNDLFGVAFIVGAIACARLPVLRVALVAAAGLVKLPLVALGALAFVDERSPLRRFALAGAAVVLCLACSFAFGGRAYLHNLFAMSGHFGTAIERALHALDVVLALAALACALAARRFAVGAAWSSSAMAAFIAPWYGVWTLPYAVSGGFAALVLVAEPVVAYLFSWNYVATPLSAACAVPVVFGPLVYAVVAARRARRGTSAAGDARSTAA